MSKLEDTLEQYLKENNIEFKKQVPIPIETWPWKTEKSKSSPKCDFFLPSIDLYIEVKGYMTIEAMSKMQFLCDQKNLNYYIFQGTEHEWSLSCSIFCPERGEEPVSKSGMLKRVIQHQLKEILYMVRVQKHGKNANLASTMRLGSFINKKVKTFKEWNMDCQYFSLTN